MEPTNDTAVLEPIEETGSVATDPAPKPETKESKPRLSAEEEYDMLEGRLNRLAKKLGRERTTQENVTKQKQPDKFDDGQLAFLKAMGVDVLDDDSLRFVEDEMKESRIRDLHKLFKNPYFQSKMENRAKEAKAAMESQQALDATPKRERGAGAGDSVEYHLNKYLATGQLPADEKLKMDVIQARIAREDTSRNPFNNTRPAGTPPGF